MSTPPAMHDPHRQQMARRGVVAMVWRVVDDQGVVKGEPSRSLTKSTTHVGPPRRPLLADHQRLNHLQPLDLAVDLGRCRCARPRVEVASERP